jgi:hypothetical protein
VQKQAKEGHRRAGSVNQRGGVGVSCKSVSDTKITTPKPTPKQTLNESVDTIFIPLISIVVQQLHRGD